MSVFAFESPSFRSLCLAVTFYSIAYNGGL